MFVGWQQPLTEDVSEIQVGLAKETHQVVNKAPAQV